MRNIEFRKQLLYTLFSIALILPIDFSQATLLSSHFGITLSVDGSGHFNNSWVPTPSTADYIVDDWPTTLGAPNPSPFGTLGEFFDVEAFYFDNDATKAYIAIVTSQPGSGFLDSGGSMFGHGTRRYMPGDIAIEIDPNPGLGNPHYPKVDNYEYGIILKPYLSSTGSDISTPNPDLGKVKQTISNSQWEYYQGGSGYPNGYPDQGYSQLTNIKNGMGISMGNAVSFSYYDAGITENGFTTWVAEAVLMLSQIGSPTPGTDLALRFSPDCNNDLLFLHADIDALIPEPSTFLLLGAGLLGLWIFKRRNFSL